MNIIEKVNRTRYTLKELLENEWDVSKLSDLSIAEVEKMYNVPSSKNTGIASFGVASGCNFTIHHKKIPSHSLHVIYYNFPEIGRESSKVTKTAVDKIHNLYKSDVINKDDSILIIINDNVSETLETSFNDLNILLQTESDLEDIIVDEMEKNKIMLEKRHFRNVFIFNVDILTNNLLEHRLVPKQTAIREKQDIKKILEECNCSINQLPIILKNDTISKLIRLTPGDICRIERKSSTCGEYPFYRLCK
jgi:DNA-directed RNA polymerase subunit H (RpoH/RPB5)